MPDVLSRHQVLTVAAIAAMVFFVWILQGIVLALFAAYVLAAALLPLVELSDRYLWRSVAVLLVYGVLISLVVGIFIPAGSAASSQFPDFASRFDDLFKELSRWVPFMRGVDVGSIITGASGNAVSFATGILSSTALAISTIVMSIYLLYDWHRIHNWIVSFFPAHRAKAQRVVASLEMTIGGWVRGQLALSAIVGALVFVALMLYRLPFAPLLGIIAALFEIIPYIGPIIAAVPAVVLALSASFTDALIVGAIYTAIQQLENHLLAPLIMKRSVSLHPIAVIVVIWIGFELFGIPGALLAVPAAALIRVIVDAVYSW